MATYEGESAPVDVFLHVGTPKTGTSSIQLQLGDNREVLARHGILYPNIPGHARHARLGFFIKSDEELEDLPNWRRGKGAQLTPEQYRKWFRRTMLAEVEEAAPDSVVFSDEALFTTSDGSLERLGEFVRLFADDVRVHVVAYLRRQDDHLISRYQQSIKSGRRLTLLEFVQQDRQRLYDYSTRLGRLQGLLKPASMRIRPFERSAFPEGSLTLDFLETVGAAHVHAELEPIRQQRNESLSADAVEFLRLVNVLRIHNQGQDRRLLDHRDMVRQLAEHVSGPSLTVPDEHLDELMERWSESNAAVARDHLGRADGVLFREPRKSAGLTPVQQLAAERANEIMDLFDWTDQDRADLLAVLAETYATG